MKSIHQARVAGPSNDTTWPSAADVLAAALELHAVGINVLPARRGSKRPTESWGRWQKERQSEAWVRQAFSNDQPKNLLAITGSVSRLTVLDCATPEAESYWRSRLGRALEETTCVETGRGRHFWFRLAEGEVRRGRSGDGWDIKAEGGLVVAPPSVHETGRS